MQRVPASCRMAACQIEGDPQADAELQLLDAPLPWLVLLLADLGDPDKLALMGTCHRARQLVLGHTSALTLRERSSANFLQDGAGTCWNAHSTAWVACRMSVSESEASQALAGPCSAVAHASRPAVLLRAAALPERACAAGTGSPDQYPA